MSSPWGFLLNACAPLPTLPPTHPTPQCQGQAPPWWQLLRNQSDSLRGVSPDAGAGAPDV